MTIIPTQITWFIIIMTFEVWINHLQLRMWRISKTLCYSIVNCIIEEVQVLAQDLSYWRQNKSCIKSMSFCMARLMLAYIDYCRILLGWGGQRSCWNSKGLFAMPGTSRCTRIFFCSRYRRLGPYLNFCFIGCCTIVLLLWRSNENLLCSLSRGG